MSDGFDPDFDDCQWTDAWTRIPIMQVVPGEYESFTVKSWQMSEAEICGQRVSLSPPLEVRGLIASNGTLWMSDVPQERLMMVNNARASRGRVLVGGLGLGLYAQYVMPIAESIHIVEANPAIAAVVEPLVQMAARTYNIDLVVESGNIRDTLTAPPVAAYDTIFLDTWDTLDAANLPAINRLRDLALPQLAPGGRVLLWGYHWMVRLFEQAAERLLQVEPADRTRWLEVLTRQRPAVMPLLIPVIEHFEGQSIEDFDPALAWCRDYIIHLSAS